MEPRDKSQGIYDTQSKQLDYAYWCGLTVFLISLFFAGIGNVNANPTNGTIIAGSANIAQSPGYTQITQTSDKTAINWQSFSINNGETTQFLQPSSSSIALNRVLGADPSAIFGNLLANGRIILINPAGILFGPGSRVDVAGLIATTANLSNEDFMSGNYHFIQSPNFPTSSVINEGYIHAADEGLVALVAPGVANRGVIEARLGKVALASGNEFTVDLYGDQLINLSVDNPTTQRARDSQGNVLSDAISNTGRITADGGSVLLSAQVARDVVDRVINTSGIIESRSIGVKNGSISIGGGQYGIVHVSGQLNVSGLANGETGGTLKVLGEKVGVFAGSRINASGNRGGGTVLIGGNYRGQGTTQRAKATYVDRDAIIEADAIEQGDGGQVIVWSDESTRMYGQISARGGQFGGNGGLIETSGKWLDIGGAVVVASAPSGDSGMWLLDPLNVSIVSAATGTSFGGTFAGDLSLTTWTPDNSPSNVANGDINQALNNGTSVTITTDDSGGVVGAGTAGVGNITQQAGANISKTAGADTTFTLEAANSITLNGTIANTSTSGVLNVVLNASQTTQDNADGLGGNITINSNISTLGGNLTINNPLGSINILSGVTLSTMNSAGINGTDNLNVENTPGGAGTDGQNAGDIDITTQNTLDLSDISILASGATGGNGGTGGFGSAGDPQGGDGGAGGAGGAGGNITINITNGGLMMNGSSLSTIGGNGGNGGGGGISEIAGGDGGAGGTAGNGGLAGNITLTLNGTLDVNNSSIIANGGDGGSNINTFGGFSNNNGGDGGAGGSGGNAGSIFVTLNSGDFNLTNSMFTASGGLGNIGGIGGTQFGGASNVAGSGGDGGNGGNGGLIVVTLNETGNITLMGGGSSFVSASGGNGGTGGIGGTGAQGDIRPGGAAGQGGNGGDAGQIVWTGVSTTNTTVSSYGITSIGGQGGTGGEGGFSSGTTGRTGGDGGDGGLGGTLTFHQRNYSQSGVLTNPNDPIISTVGGQGGTGGNGGGGTATGASGNNGMDGLSDGAISISADAISFIGLVFFQSFQNIANFDQNGSPLSFLIEQTGSISDTFLPDESQFLTGMNNMDYTIQSDNGSITITNADKINNTDLTLIALNSFISLDLTLDLSLVEAHFTAGTINFPASITTLGGEQVYTANTGNQLAVSTTFSTGGGDFTLIPLSGIPLGYLSQGSTTINTANGNITIDIPYFGSVFALNLFAGNGDIFLNDAITLAGGAFTSTSNDFTLNDNLTSQGADGINGDISGKAGGNIDITLLNNGIFSIPTGTTINTSGGHGFTATSDGDPGGNGGNAGHIIITTDTAQNFISTTLIAMGGDGGNGANSTTQGQAGGNAGNGGFGGTVSLTSAQDNIVFNNASITTTGGNGGNGGNGGPATVIIQAGATGTGGTGGSGGSITLNASNGTVTLTNSIFSTTSGNGGTAGLPADGSDGLASVIGSAGGAAGSSGNITIFSEGNFTSTNTSIITSGGTGGIGGNAVAGLTGATGGAGGNGGNGGHVTITIENGDFLWNDDGTHFLSTAGGNGGNGGTGGRAGANGQNGGTGGTAGSGGNGGNIQVSITENGNITFNQSIVLVGGGNGGIGGGGGDLNTGTHNRGGTGGVGGTGGSSGTINFITSANSNINITDSILAASGGNGGNGGVGGPTNFPIASTGGNGGAGGNGGNGGIMPFTSGNYFEIDSTLSSTGGNFGSGGAAGTLGDDLPVPVPGANGIAGTSGTIQLFANNASLMSSGTLNLGQYRFTNYTNNGPMISLFLEQDLAISDVNIPAPTQFPNGLNGMIYTIQSDSGSITLATPDKVNNTDLTLTALNSFIDLAAAFELSLVAAHFTADTILFPSTITTTGGDQIYTANTSSQPATGATFSSNGGDFTLTTLSGVPTGYLSQAFTTINTANGDININTPYIGNSFALNMTAGNGDIFLNQSLSSLGAFTINSVDQITVNAAITLTSGPFNSTANDFTNNSTITLGNNNFLANGTHLFLNQGTLQSTGGDITINYPTIQWSGPVFTGLGDIQVTGNAFTNTAPITTEGGNFTLNETTVNLNGTINLLNSGDFTSNNADNFTNTATISTQGGNFAINNANTANLLNDISTAGVDAPVGTAAGNIDISTNNSLAITGITFDAHGGNSAGNPGGNAGIVTLTSNSVNLTDVTFNTTGGTGTVPGIDGGWIVHADHIILNKTGSGFFDITGALLFSRATNFNAPPLTFTYQQDDSIDDTIVNLPVLAQFGGNNINGMIYTLQSDNGSITLQNANQEFDGATFIANANTTIAWLNAITFMEPTGSIQMNANTILMNEVTTQGGSQSYNATGEIRVNDNTTLISQNGNINLTGPMGGTGNLTLTAGNGNITFTNVLAGVSGVIDLFINSVYNLTVNGSLYVANYTQTTGNITNFGNNSLHASGDASITSNFIFGRIFAQNTFMNGIQGMNATVHVLSLLLDGLNGGTLFGTVNGIGGEGAARLVRLVDSAMDRLLKFTMNGCPVIIGCSLPQEIFADLEQERFSTQFETLKPCSFEPASGESDQLGGGGDCVDIKIDKRLLEDIRTIGNITLAAS